MPSGRSFPPPFSPVRIDPKKIENPFGETKEPKKPRPIDKNVKDATWIKYFGNKAHGKCYCCKIRPIHITNFHLGHNRATAKGGKDDIPNLRPICAPCNQSMGTISIEKYRKKYFPGKKKKKIKRIK